MDNFWSTFRPRLCQCNGVCPKQRHCERFGKSSCRFNVTFVYRGNIGTRLSFLVVSTAKARTVGDQSVFIAVAAARKVNKMHLTFFLLFWTEHILERSRLKSDGVEKAVLKLTTPSPSAAPNPALPAPPRLQHEHLLCGESFAHVQISHGARLRRHAHPAVPAHQHNRDCFPDSLHHFSVCGESRFSFP